MWTANEGLTGVVTQLLQAGADTNIANTDGLLIGLSTSTNTTIAALMLLAETGNGKKDEFFRAILYRLFRIHFIIRVLSIF